MSIKGTETEKNLLKSFAGESQAKNRYTFFAKQAKKDGYVKVAKVFELTAGQEEVHAKRFFRFLEGGPVEITAAYPAGVIANTSENLKAAAAGENEEWTELYPGFADLAEKEGFKDVAAAYRSIVVAEKNHEERYLKLLKDIEDERFFDDEEEVLWECENCGYLHKGKSAPEKCPACLHPKSYFYRKNLVL